MTASDDSSPRALPPAIAQMDQEETVCSVCGVSYLVFREIKALEKRIRSLESDGRDKEESVRQASQALEAALKANSASDEIVAQVQSGCDQKIRTLQTEHQAGLRAARAEGEAAGRELLARAEAAGTEQRARQQRIAEAVRGLAGAARGLREEQSRLRLAVKGELEHVAAVQLQSAAAVQQAVAEEQERVRHVEQAWQAAEASGAKGRTEASQRQQELAESQAESARLGRELDAVRFAGEQVAASLDEKGLALVFAESELEKERAQVRELQDSLEAVLSRVAKAEQASTLAEQAHANSSRQLSELSGEASMVERQLADKTDELNSLNNQRKAEQAEAAKAAREQQSALADSEAECKRLQAELGSVGEQLVDAQAGSRSSNLKLTETVERFKRQAAKLQVELEAANKRADQQMASERGAAASRLSQVEAKLRASQQAHEVQAQALKQAQTEASVLRQKLDELSGTEKQLRDELASSASANQRSLSDAASAAEHELKEREGVIEQLRVELTAVSKAKEAAEKAAKEADERNAANGDWEGKLAEFEGLVGRLAGSLRSKEAMVQTLQGTVQRECEERQLLVQKVALLEEQLQAKPLGSARRGSRGDSGNKAIRGKLPPIN